jgi:hypothetical protein
LELTAEDLFEGGEMVPNDMVVPEELELGVLSNDEVLIIGEMLANIDVDDDEETSGVEGTSVRYVINWGTPPPRHPPRSAARARYFSGACTATRSARGST